MTVEEFVNILDRGDAAWSNVENKRSPYQEVHAILLLTELAGLPSWDASSGSRAIAAAEHDQIWLNFDIEDVAKNIAEAQAIELDACGVFTEDGESLSMWA